MAQPANMMLRRADTPAHRPSSGTGRLPDDLIADQVRRLALFSAIGAGLWTFGLVIDFVLVPLVSALEQARVAIWIEVAGIITGILMFLYVRYVPHAPERKRVMGLVYFLLNAAGISAMNRLSVTTAQDLTFFLSWSTIAILVFSMIAVAPPRQLLFTSLLAASMDPLGVWIAHLKGLPVPSAGFTLVLYLPNYICAVVGLLPSLMLQRLGTRLRQAQELGSYRLVELLGQGGMGEVWRAEHRLLARSAAVKLIRPDLLGTSTDEDARRMLTRFEREAQATASLHSPHTIQVFDFGTTGEGNFYYVMELLAGRDLESLVRNFGPLPADRALFLMRQVCHSLADAHARGLVHRDVKPANIYTCRMGLEYDFVKVLDFGLVKVPDRGALRHSLMTADQRASGTPAYMAPEVILGEADVDRRADVYAIGCVTYYLLTGQLVFEADTPMKMLMQHVNARPVPPSQRTELAIPPELDAIVLACLDKDPAKRPQNAQELFQMAQHCTSCNGWNQDAAREWWTTHLPELCGNLMVDVSETPAASLTGPV